MESHRVKQQDLIEQLKQQLEDLERYAYETGEAGLPQNLIVERQKIIIGELYFVFCTIIMLFTRFRGDQCGTNQCQVFFVLPYAF